MLQINSMDTTEVTLEVNNVWSQSAVPEQMRIFVHTNGIDAILQERDGDGFQCLDTAGKDIDIDGSDTEFTVECYRESDDDDAAWLAVLDVVITDDIICGSNDVPHPCFPDEGPILESCSWRIVVPCGDESLCTEEPTPNPTGSPTAGPTASPTTGPTASPTAGPTASPTASPTAGPTASPTAGPTASPTASPTAGPTASPTAGPTAGPTASPTAGPTASPSPEPTAELDTFGDDDGTDDIFFPPIGPEECPDDILLVKHIGVTEYSEDIIRIISQDTSSVTVEVRQTFTDANSTIDNLYYQYQQNHFNNKCFEEQDLNGEDYMEITIQCTVHSQIALLELWVADDITKGVLSEGDNAVIPDCCHPTIPEETPVTKYMVEIKCVTECPEVYE